ncbi:MAG: Na(+)-translocating NADH-quinone reductase subunit C [Bacteroidetes bacterium]|nr:Na(+)-translocating NADH-quinone reductase subunit C [Bacteroidota bacterium]MBU1113537.1 Na(+)-translocating NADH-quinone reductase subunit C [Bacteroidota bacterium]MBU1800339.1 Na(+)-translocating NADH-quinone reductase subunit C [Bacteroidota bacterium]
MSKDSTKKTLLVALGVCFVASILVSTAAVELKPIQELNKELDLRKNILSAGDLYKDGIDINNIFKEKVSAQIIDLETGDVIPESKYDDVLNIENFNVEIIASSPKWGKVIPSSDDIAGIKKMPKVMAIYTVKDDSNRVEKYILPIYGKGLWSTLYGFIALNKDFETVEGFTFYQHGETPGLGGEVDNPKWKSSWIGKQIFDQSGNLKIEVIKGIVDRDSDDLKYQVDGLSGATLTTRGVNNLVRFWLSEKGYGPFMNKLKGENNG